MRIFVTGAAAHLARPLLPALCQCDWVSAVCGVDLKASGFAHSKYTEHICDVRDPRLARLMLGHDAVIHLAFVVLRSHLGTQRKNRALVHDINVNGSIAVFESAALQGITRIVHISSAAVYGAWPSNTVLATETQARRSMPGFSYSQDKNAVEDWLDAFELRYPHTYVTRLRPHVILGAHAQAFLRLLLAQPFYPYFRAPLPLTQCVWEEDVVAAMLAVLQRDVRGAFNLAAEPALPFRDLLRLTHRYTFPLPFTALRWLHRAAWTVSGAGEEPGWMDGMRYSLAVDCARAKSELDWMPRYSTQACVTKMLGSPEYA